METTPTGALLDRLGDCTSETEQLSVPKESVTDFEPPLYSLQLGNQCVRILSRPFFLGLELT